MEEQKHTILCVDDEKSILNSLKRLLRKEEYRILTASSGEEGFEILKENDVHLVISDQRMPQMSGTEFLGKVKSEYPDVMRIILSGYTDVDSITEAVNKGHIYKFLLKPWNDQNLKLEIKQALEQCDLIQTNKRLHQKVLEQNEELRRINEDLEDMVKERTKDLEIQNQALELSYAILEDLPFPIIGVSLEGMIVVINHEVQSLFDNGTDFKIGKRVSDYFSDEVEKKIAAVLESNNPQVLEEYLLTGSVYHIDFIPLSRRFQGKGIIMVFKHL